MNISNENHQKPDLKNLLRLAEILCLGMIISAILCSCGIRSSKSDTAKLRDLDFEIISEEAIPAELMTIINERKEKAFKTTFEDGNGSYIVIGYGRQPTGGYSIKVHALYETKDSLHIETEFIGPSKNETVTQTVSYPYIVVKTTLSDKPVIFS